jgi:L-rhamnose mutarotase
MKQYAMTLDLKDDPEAIVQYRRHHAQVWPEVVDALREVGIIDLHIWLLGRRLFMLLETQDDFDPETDLSRYLTLHPRCQEWEDLMGTWQQPLPQALPGEKWLPMERIFQLSSAMR